jgi:hypothetical protein
MKKTSRRKVCFVSREIKLINSWPGYRRKRERSHKLLIPEMKKENHYRSQGC